MKMRVNQLSSNFKPKALIAFPNSKRVTIKIVLRCRIYLLGLAKAQKRTGVTKISTGNLMVVLRK